MNGFTAGEAVRRLEHAIGRPIDTSIVEAPDPHAPADGAHAKLAAFQNRSAFMPDYDFKQSATAPEGVWSV